MRHWTVGAWLPRRLGSQLQVMAALSLSISIGLFGLFSIREQSGQALVAMELQATSIARDLALLSEPLMVADKLDDLEVLLKNSMELQPILEVLVIDAKGQPVSHLQRSLGEQPRVVFDPAETRLALPTKPDRHLSFDEEQERVIAWQPIVSGTLLGWVRVDHGTQELTALRERIWVTTLLACVLACLASVAMMRGLLRRPLQSLDAAQRFATDLQNIEGQQLSDMGGPLEMSILAGALNQASSRLFEQRRTIEASLLQLHEQEAALARNNEQLRTIFSLSPDALLSIDDQGRASFANEAFFNLTGLVASEVIGQPWARVDEALCSRAEDKSLQPPLAQLMAAKQSEPVHVALALPRPSVLEVLARAGQTASVSWLIYMRDITRESEIDRMKTEFLSTAAHELRTPMTSIYGCVELMTTRELTPARQRDLLNIVNRHSRVMMNIVNELLDISRLEARGSADFCFETLPLTDAVSRVVRDFVAPEGRAAPELINPDNPSLVHVDPEKLGQVVGNLLSNAYKYSSTGPVQVRALALRHTPTGMVTGFEVEDHGIGMTPEQLARVTERFYRADTSGHVLGTGLGMSIVDNIVTLLGGTMSLRSQPGEGTTVSVWLPAVLPAAHHAEPVTDSAGLQGVAPVETEQREDSSRERASQH